MWGSSELRRGLALVALVGLAGCRSASPIEDVEEDRFASTRPAVLELRDLDRRMRDLARRAPDEHAARANLMEATAALVAAEPGWLAPRRLLDDLRRAALLGPWVWAEHDAAWRASGDADAAYLLGRLETGAAALERFEDAVAKEPRHLWAWHGIAWQAGAERPDGRAARAFLASLQLIEDHHELMSVAMARVRRLESHGRFDAARQLAEDVLELPGWDAADRATWRATALRMDLRERSGTLELEVDGGQMSFRRAPDPERAGQLEAALELIDAGSDLPDSEALVLASVVLTAELEPSRLELLTALQRALAGRTSALAVARRERYAKQLDGLVLGALVSPGPDGLGSLDDTEWRAALALARGDFGAWLAAWRERLPDFVRAADLEVAEGVWVRAPIAALLHDASLADDPRRLAATLAEAGWIEAADAVRVRLGPEPVGARTGEPGGDAALRELVGTKREALAAWKRIWQRTGGEDGELAVLMEELAALAERLDVPHDVRGSALERYAGLAGIVLPGPRFAARADAPSLPGLAAWAFELGRLAQLGFQGGSSDGTLRSVVALEYVRGEHLGAPYEGTVFWCQGVDVPGSYERAGAQIAGAALHPGYWVDLEVVRDMTAEWALRGAAFAHLVDRARIGGELFPEPPACGRGAEAWRVPLLGEGDRLALAVQRDRGPVRFEELLEYTAVHEEGHLVDRARFLPLGEHWPAVARFLIEANFSGQRIMERLEYRAELVALCVLDEPRIALAEVLGHVDAGEAGGGGATPHASGYAWLLRDLTALAAERVRGAEGGTWGGLRAGAYVRWQWHRIEPEALRELALELAAAEGLVVSG